VGSVAALFLSGFLWPPVTSASEPVSGKPPERVISLNLCTDQLLLLLADPSTIVGLSQLASDCANAPLCDMARHYPAIRTNAETILSLKPDLVVTGTSTLPVTLLAAKSVGTRLEMFGPADSLADIPASIRRMAKLLGVPERGEILVKAFDERLAHLSSPLFPDAPEAVIYAANGFVTGANSLPDDVLRHAGFRNLSTDTGRKWMQAMSLEKLISAQPDLLVLDRSGPGTSQAQALLDNRALERAFHGTRRLNVPTSLWLCGLPQTLDALEELAKARKMIQRGGK
jgi:iron complex transport system substrate-binding protein